MWKDPIVEEIRAHREAHAEKFDYDLAAICRDLRQQQAESGQKVVTLRARRGQSAKSGARITRAASGKIEISSNTTDEASHD